MKFNKRIVITGIITILIAAFLGAYQLPYYIYKPGSAEGLNPIIEIQDGYESEGDMHLVTIRGGQATPIGWALAKIRPYHQLYPIDQVRPEDVTEEEYHSAQLQLMESSQEAAKVVAYKKAKKDINIEYNGVFVMNVLDGMPAAQHLQAGDRIVKVDDQEISESQDLIDYVSDMEEGRSVELTIRRNDENLTREVELAAFPDQPDKVGIGITLVTDRSVEVSPQVNVKSGEIGGPSAGLMFSLEMYDQLTEEDITKGYHIAGTGEISYEGEVGRIGGIDKKVVAAHNTGVDIFFAPNENGADNSNYQTAKQAAEDLDTDMKIVPVDTFDEALEYLNNLEPKS
ncbi:SepM family pheromone-processing serine protease [Thalassobacillus sp. CUG 92003]|uniref:SepM family pheromone-processing serine protease n=1 Tax=Thalassobacillus sp. CUG 92003 TaxID=2736641 RepID=UPI0015E6EBE9|nr:SepM family pheromone-processing serine protease [Thalassobacillus sp. CUG 92003]